MLFYKTKLKRYGAPVDINVNKIDFNQSTLISLVLLNFTKYLPKNAPVSIDRNLYWPNKKNPGLHEIIIKTHIPMEDDFAVPLI